LPPSPPQPLVAEAAAVWALHRGDMHAACTALMAAGQWPEAHEVLAQHVAPCLMLDKRCAVCAWVWVRVGVRVRV